MPAIESRRARLNSLVAAQAAAAAATPHQITTLEAWNLKEPGTTRAWSLLRLATKEGLEGWGESAPLTRGEVEQLRALALHTPASAYESLRLKLSTRPGAAAVNIAALDILGKAAKAPVYQLLGGPTRNSVRAFTALHGANDDAIAKDMERCRAAGFKAFAVPVPAPPFRNSGKAYVNAAKARLETLLKMASPDHDFIVQGLGRLTPGDAASLADAFEHVHLMWFDEPCSTSSIGALRKIAEENVTPLGFGQNVTDPAHFQNLLRDDAIDIIRPEIAIHGITGIRKIAALAETYYTAVAPRHNQGPVNTAAAFHLAASLPNFFIQHIPCPEPAAAREMRAAITGTSVESVRDGFAALSNTPGLGVSVNRQALSRFAEVIA
ncbi:MAG: mandelate racemase/muconate lactonizing enzyme family protein [Bryobacteraceae bacterium]|nr:mandelate racemase/muconate lactonizing enzyme family protein [Bryobacteraceae bacterium]